MQYKIIVNRKIPALAILIIIISIILHSYYSRHIWFSYTQQYYPLEFSNADWIGIKDNTPQGYYRKEISINDPIINAWLKVAASDTYQLFVNGKLIGQEMFPSTEVSGVYDITRYLNDGKNIIAVCVRRFNINEINKIKVELGYINKAGVKSIIGSDNTWKAAQLEERQAHGEAAWNTGEFNDSEWGFANIINDDTENDIHFVSVNPSLFEMPVNIYWIWSPDTSANSVTFSYPFSISSKIKDAWLRISIDGRYQLYINGQRVGSSEISNRYIDLYDIGSFIKQGENQITITASKLPSNQGILVDGFIYSQSGTYRINEINWKVASIENNISYPVTLLTPYNPLYDGVLTKRFVDPAITGVIRIQSLFAISLWFVFIGVIWIFIWFGSSFMIHKVYNINLNSAMLIDAVTHLPSIIFLAFLYLLTYDINHNISFPFQNIFIIISVLLILLIKLLFILERHLNTYSLKNSNIIIGAENGNLVSNNMHASKRTAILHKVSFVLILCIFIIGGIIRIRGVDYQSLYHDEIQMINYAKGIFEKGYPFKMIGPIEMPLNTYEILPYPIALSMLVFGSNDFAYRLPAALLGTLSILLIFYITLNIFNRWAAIIASTIYAFFPPAIVWAKFLWHPQQAQFFALLTTFLFYKAIEKKIINYKYFYMATITYILLYLTWEGTGFFLGSLFLGLLAVKGRDLGWMREKHIWIGVFSITGVIAIQLIRRFFYQIPYLVVGSGLSEMTAPSLFFLNPMYDPYYYIKNFLWREYNFLLTFLCIIGIPFAIKNRSLLYYYTMVFATLLMMTSLFAANAVRYVIYLEPMLIISAAASLVYIFRYILQFIKNVTSRVIRITVYAVFIICSVVLWAGTNDYLYKFYRFDYPHPYGNHWRSNEYYINNREPIQFVANNYKKGDLIIAVMPHATELYGNGLNTDYFLQSVTVRQVLYDITEEHPMYLERTIGKPTIRNLEEFMDILNRNHRIWIVAIPDSIFQRITDDSIRDYLSSNSRVVFESYNAKIYLLEG